MMHVAHNPIRSAEPILEVSNLVVTFDGEDGVVRAVDDISLTIPDGLTLGLVGESGCGKSVTALSIMRLLPRPSGKILQGHIRFKNLEITQIPAENMQAIRGKRISMIFQEPMTALNPVHRIGRQVEEVFRLHQSGLTDRQRLDKSVEMLSKMGISDPLDRMVAYPHQISGGMRQRVMIAMALACHPELLIADEPTTALDVTIQAQILELMRKLQAETGMAILFITHDMGVVAEMCDQVVVMYAGKIAESASVHDIFSHPRHPYTRGLLESIPRLETPSKTRLNVIRGMAPSLHDLPSGCRFENRCPMAQSICQTAHPEIREVVKDHFVSCYFA
jgi:oligopeptide/dipeptide ABC transporter ATP-binding protein